MNQHAYQIYARTSYSQPLTLFGHVDVQDGLPDQADVMNQLAQVGSDEWVEVIIIPDEAMLWARREKDESA